MSVYFVRRKDDPSGLIKIGSSGNVASRVRSLSTATPGGIELLASCAGGAEVEHRIHRELFASRVAGGEWFLPTDEVMAYVAKTKALPGPADEKGPKQTKSHLVKPEDEFCDDITVESRFYLNGLVTREWHGVGDTPEEARNRVAERFGLSPEKCRKIWYAMAPSVDGDTYRVLSNEYARTMNAEGRATARHLEVLRIERYFQGKFAQGEERAA
ncbi:GIY-YIG nuclease family protein [Mesorhizobium sp. C120A]|uniref:GIY-YIG nuclease family protein n=1 Tax=unclassified Mesorhizobium TaxID=325217 RepID=UPI0003D04E14|nr:MULTISPECIES: GIY-YIG nuclease family protein [unclassified Mesorhizobium]ESZ60676.1 hypothetical protein X728_15195 [Mesorhizobium sp. L103C120A0]WJI43721.1 GIY-YIG nuclease family protein [Mesorhizobium sp. C120A]